jgi:flavin reductase (DIM6/NTAB) family NADH-FMN oxidoreductase RutF
VKRSLGAKTILVPTPVLVVGTYDAEGRPNVMTAAWGGLCCSRPPCVAVSLRVPTATHGNISRRGAFTVNVPSEDHIREVDYFGIVSGERENKWAVTRLHPQRAEHVDAPYVEEFPLVLECRLVQTVELGLHTQFIGEIVDVKADEACLREGKVDLERVRPCVFSPDTSGYYRVGDFLGEAFAIGRPFRAG